jgi:hypothetical protein
MKNEFIITKTVAKTLVFVAAFILAGCGDNFITPPPEIPLQPQDRTPAWSPDGLKIAWTVARGGGEIWTMEADGSNQSKLVDGVEPSFPDSAPCVYGVLQRPEKWCCGYQYHVKFTATNRLDMQEVCEVIQNGLHCRIRLNLIVDLMGRKCADG